MKDNTAEVRENLKKILRKVPTDFALFDVRRYIILAITKIEEVEKRRAKRDKDD